MMVNQHAQNLDPETAETEAAKLNSAIIHLNIYTCAFPAVTCQDAPHEKGL